MFPGSQTSMYNLCFIIFSSYENEKFKMRIKFSCLTQFSLDTVIFG